jgi:endogenous inhibitor of DNA gyrase (YacG/DUF329 family)
MTCPDCGKPMDIIFGIPVCQECDDISLNKTLPNSDWIQESTDEIRDTEEQSKS